MNFRHARYGARAGPWACHKTASPIDHPVQDSIPDWIKKGLTSQPFSYSVRSMRVASKVISKLGPRIIKCFAYHLERLRIVGKQGYWQLSRPIPSRVC
jgi:hypothetical protein